MDEPELACSVDFSLLGSIELKGGQGVSFSDSFMLRVEVIEDLRFTVIDEVLHGFGGRFVDEFGRDDGGVIRSRCDYAFLGELVERVPPPVHVAEEDLAVGEILVGVFAEAAEDFRVYFGRSDNSIERYEFSAITEFKLREIEVRLRQD